MWEMIKNAWMGWSQSHTGGKYLGLLLLVLFYLWSRRSRVQEQADESGQKLGEALLRYTSVMTVLCICPVTAALLMYYQTRFYDYPWIWALVPLTPMLAYGAVLLLAELLHTELPHTAPLNAEVLHKRQQQRTWQRVLMCMAVAAMIFLSGGMGSREAQLQTQKQEYETAELLLADICEENGQEAVCLWGPTTVLEYVRLIDTDVQVAYGRNMWDEALNAYLYDTYDEEKIALYEAMDEAENRARFTDMSMLSLAQEQGVTHLILPGYVLQDDVLAIQEQLQVQPKQLQGYFVFDIRKEIF